MNDASKDLQKQDRSGGGAERPRPTDAPSNVVPLRPRPAAPAPHDPTPTPPSAA